MQAPSPAAFRRLGWSIVWGTLFCLLGPEEFTHAQKGSAPGEEPKLLVKEVGPGLFEIGRVRFSKNDRAVRIPVEVNMREGAVEYFLVTTTGKTHESVFRTD